MIKENGAISIFAILSMMFFLIFIMVAYNNVMQKAKIQKETEEILVDYYKSTQTAKEITESRNGNLAKLNNLRSNSQKYKVLEKSNDNKYIYSNGYVYSIQNSNKEYQQLEYIESTGTQYIMTNIIPNDTIGAYAKLSSADIPSDLVYFGSRKSIATRFWVGNNGYIYLGWNYNSATYDVSDSVFTVELNFLNSRKKMYNGNLVDTIGTELDSSNTTPITIFAGNDNGTVRFNSKIKLYEFKISYGTKITNDFIPCFRISDNVAGLYDLMTDTFYINSGTGTFIKGPEV